MKRIMIIALLVVCAAIVILDIIASRMPQSKTRAILGNVIMVLCIFALGALFAMD